MRFFVFLLPGFLFLTLPVDAQQPDTAEAPIEVMIVGTVHLDNPGRDVNNPTVPDVLTPEKQEELDVLRKALAEFRPTKITLEVRKRHQAAIDSLYQAFRVGRLDSSFAVGDLTSRRSEQYQIGFRLARQLGHEHVWAVDHALPMHSSKVIAYAQQRDTAFVSYFQRWSKRQVGRMDSLLQRGTLREVYRHLNRPETVRQYHAPYVRMAAVAGDTTYVGADVVATYYERNLRIFANIEEVAEPGDRVIAIFGAGHLPFLRPLIEASPQMRFVDPLRYL